MWMASRSWEWPFLWSSQQGHRMCSYSSEELVASSLNEMENSHLGTNKGTSSPTPQLNLEPHVKLLTHTETVR